MAKNFNTLLARMSPENQARVQAGANEMLKELALQELRTASNLTPEQVAEAMTLNQDVGSSPRAQTDLLLRNPLNR